MSENSTSTYTSEERILAALSHAAIIMFGWGLIIPLVIWITQRKKSRFASFQALQTLTYQLLQLMIYYVVSFLAMIPFFGFILITVMLTDSENATALPYFMFLGVLLLFLLIFGVMALYVLYGLIGAIACLGGMDFRYLLLGNWVQRYLESGKTEETEADE